MRSIFRIMQSAIGNALNGERLRLGDYLVEPRLNRLTHGTATLVIEPKVMRFLLCLAAQPGEVVRQGEIRSEVWGALHVVDGVLARAAYQLRRAIAELGGGLEVETIRQVGYRLSVAAPYRRRVPLLALLSGPRPAWLATSLSAGLCLYLMASQGPVPLAVQTPTPATHQPAPLLANAAPPASAPERRRPIRTPAPPATPRAEGKRGEIMVFAEGRFRLVPNGTAFAESGPGPSAPSAPSAPAPPPAPLPRGAAVISPADPG